MGTLIRHCCKRPATFVVCRNFAVSSARLSSLEKTGSMKIVPCENAVEKGELAQLAGIPEAQTSRRKATIFLPSRNAMQSGTHNMRKWALSFDTNARWENPLMGWASTGDPMSNVQLKFSTREAAIAYAQTHGWDYEVEEPTLPQTRPKSYGSNFAWNKRTRISTK